MHAHPYNIVFLDTFVNNSSLVALLDSRDGLMPKMTLAIIYINFELIVKKTTMES